MSQKIDLSPGPVAGPYQIPAEDWAIVNKRVSMVLQSTLGGSVGNFYQKLKALPNYQQLLAVAQTWKDSTFDGLVSFASSLATFGSQTVQGYLDLLGPLVDKLSQGDTSVKPQFDRAVLELAQVLTGLSSQASALVQPLNAFDIQMTQADVSGSGAQDPIWNVFSKNAGTAFDDIDGRINILSKDLSNLKTTVDQNLENDLPVVIQLVDLPGVKQQWQEVGKLASGFTAAAPQQRQFLTSDAWQYGDPPIQENSLQYRIKNQQFGDGKCLEAGSVVAIQNQSNSSGQNWKFIRFGDGFYQLMSSNLPNMALDTYSGDSHQAFMSNSDVFFTGHAWRFVPVSDGWYRMSNLYLGEELSLQVHPDGSLWMESTTANPSQYFKIVTW
jgi:hypothetical protein